MVVAAGGVDRLTPPLTELSRLVSHALRHEPWLYELELDDDGWVSVDALVGALREGSPTWAEIDRAMLERMVAESPKRRHEIVGDRVRALYGHSVPGRLRKESGAPPNELFHGTSSAAAHDIAQFGLLPMGRQFVHLSVDPEMAMQVRRRKASMPVLLRIRSAEAHSAGVVFWIGNEAVWLADQIPAAFIDGAASHGAGIEASGEM
jgi:putative RNA 2'-phosphotransferase